MVLQSSRSFPKSVAKVIAVIPCFNTERSIAQIVTKARGYVDQVVVINDGSADDTAQVARAAGALVMNHGQNRGYGAAIQSCFEAAKASRADVLVILDGDGQHNPDEIPKLLTPVLQEEADLVIGSRFLRYEQNMPRYRRFGIGVITFLWNVGSRVKVSDSQSGFRAYRREVFQDFSLRERGMSVSIETLEKARRKVAIIREVPVSCNYVRSTLDLQAIRHGLSVALAVVRIRLSHGLRDLIRGSRG